MSQRTAFILAAALTAFVLVVLGAVAAHIGLVGQADAAAATLPPATASPAAPQSGADPSSIQPQPDAPIATISPDLAATIALNLLPDASVLRTPELVDFQGTVAYEVVLDRGTVYVDATNGRILNNPVRFDRFPRWEHEVHEWFEGEHEDDD
jgi:hypothetical protein